MRTTAPLVCALAWTFTNAIAAQQQVQIVNEAGLPVSGAAVAIFVKGARSTAVPGTVADMAQRDKTFAPHLRVIQTGTSVNFPNFDTVRHHVYSFSPIKTFEIKLYAGTPTAPIVFDKAGTATLGCNIHDRMLGYIHVVDTPYFAVTDASGLLSFELPAGEHRIRVWTPAMGEANQGQEQGFKAGPDTLTIKVKP